ncbi:hypothetical protein BJX65DRAFT_98188 [Aspergillus insuetus]
MRANGRMLIRNPVSIHGTVLNRLLCKPLRLIALVVLAWVLTNSLVLSSYSLYLAPACIWPPQGLKHQHKTPVSHRVALLHSKTTWYNFRRVIAQSAPKLRLNLP